MSPAPIYPRIAETLRASIRTGTYAPGSPLPSEAALCAMFGTSRNTLRRALMELEREGSITTVPGSGRTVRDPAAPAGQAAEMRLAYRKIAAELRAGIERGEYEPRTPLPSEATLMKHHGVSRGTARRAYAHLRAAGVVTPVHGKGWFPRGNATGTGRTSQDVPGDVSMPPGAHT